MIQILLVEDHAMVRQGIRTMLELEDDFEIVGEASTGLGILALVKKLAPQVILLDLSLPEVDGLEVASDILRGNLNVKIIILSMYDNMACVAAAIQRGASGYVLKSSGIADLATAIRTVIAGHRYLSPQLKDDENLSRLIQTQTAPLNMLENLTLREREIMNLAAHGMRNSEIGARLFISPRTVEIHRHNLMTKLNLHTHSELVRFAVSQGILLCEPPLLSPSCR